jgi:iron complex transport system substrate-binding protein
MKTFLFIGARSAIAILLLFITACVADKSFDADRYVVLSPEIAEILSVLGVADRIVGITAECDYPPEIATKPIIGNFGQVSLERILALRPGIVFTTGLEQAEITHQLNKLRIKTVQMYPYDLHDLYNMIDSLGVLTNTKVQADSLNRHIKEKFHEFYEDMSTITNKPKVYIEIYGDPIMSVSNSSFVGLLLYYAGGENIFPVLPRDYSRVNAEDVVSLNPDVIILTYPGITARDVADRKGWGVINAVQNGRIYTVDDIDPDLILRAGHRNIAGVYALKQIIGN